MQSKAFGDETLIGERGKGRRRMMRKGRLRRRKRSRVRRG